MNINVNIERLILDGISVPYGQRPLLQAAVETELMRMLTADGPGSGMFGRREVPYVHGGAIQLTGESDPAHMGRQIAQAVYGGLNR